MLVLFTDSFLYFETMKSSVEGRELGRAYFTERKNERRGRDADGSQRLKDFYPFEVKFFIGQEQKLIPALDIFVDFFELLHIFGKQVEQLQVKVDFISNFGPVGHAAFDHAIQHQMHLFFLRNSVALVLLTNS